MLQGLTGYSSIRIRIRIRIRMRMLERTYLQLLPRYS